MGKKVVNISMGLSMVEVLIGFMALFMTWYKQTFYAGGLLSVMDLDVYVTRGNVSMTDTDACNYLGQQVPLFCTDILSSGNLQDLQQRFCAPLIRGVLPEMCSGLSSAYILGMMFTFLFFVNLFLVVASNYLRYEYVNGSPKKNYRKVAMCLDMCGLLSTMLLLVLYYPLVLLPLSSVKPRYPLTLAFSPSAGLGVGKGYLIMWMVPAFQMAMVFLSTNVKTREEERQEKRKIEEDFQEEMSDFMEVNPNWGGVRQQQQQQAGGAPGGIQMSNYGGMQQPRAIAAGQQAVASLPIDRGSPGWGRAPVQQQQQQPQMPMQMQVRVPQPQQQMMMHMQQQQGMMQHAMVQQVAQQASLTQQAQVQASWSGRGGMQPMRTVPSRPGQSFSMGAARSAGGPQLGHGAMQPPSSRGPPYF